LGSEAISASLEGVRRLAVAKQHLAGMPPKRASTEDIVSLIRDLPFVQWDPVTVVAPSHIISLWSRLGAFRISDLERLMWRDRKVFLHWTPIAFLVLTEDYPIYYSLMKRYPESLTKSWGNHIPKARQFLANHRELRRRMLGELSRGPLQPTQFRDYVRTKRSEDGWSSGNDVSNMLFHMHMSGDVMVVGRQGNQNVWGLSEEFLPDWAVKKELSEEEFEWEAAQRAIRGLGTATLSEVRYYFPPGRYQNLKSTLTRLEEESVIHPVSVAGLGGKDKRYIHDRDVPFLESVSTSAWEPRMSLLPPFDNMLRQHSRVFGFDYVREQFLPKEKRRFGTYVLPILWGERFIGRIDPKLDKQEEKLVINSVHAEPGAPRGNAIATEIRETIERLAAYLGAKEVTYTQHVPSAWRSSLR
jgi:uncharacterized protein YcaQ